MVDRGGRMTPTKVKQAILSGDRNALSELGRRGAKAKQRKLREERARRELLALDSLANIRQAHEDICPVDD